MLSVMTWPSKLLLNYWQFVIKSLTYTFNISAIRYVQVIVTTQFSHVKLSQKETGRQANGQTDRSNNGKTDERWTMEG